MPATITAIINQKGGTGKTCTCASLGIGLAREGKNVLLVDFDPQSSLTISLGYDKPDDLPVTVATLMMKAMNGEAIATGEGILHHREVVDVLPSCIELSGVEAAAVNALSRENILKQILTPLRKQYDHILIDCSPSLSMLNLNALSAADNVIIPVQPQYLSAKGLVDLLNTIKKVKRQINPKLRTEGIVMTMMDNRTNFAKEINALIRDTYVPYGSYTIRELEAPDGYLLSQTVIPVEIDATYQNSVEPLATVVNQASRLRYKKVDTSGKLLPGVEFSLINADTGEIVEIVTSDDAGEFVFTRFTFGNWIIRETKTPEGYNIMPDIELTVDENWVEPEPFTLVNIPNHYEFVKTDNKGNPMPGVKFTLEDGAGNILRDLVSGEDGIVHVTDLTPSVYIIREIETAEGYTLSEETIKVVIDEKYIVPDEMFQFVNYPNIQTGAGFEMTPLMWSGIILALCALLSIVAILKLKKHQK